MKNEDSVGIGRPTTILPDTETMYRALMNRDSGYDGIFFIAVKSTGVFCRPTCTARKPKRENVEFFGTTREALLHGYRPCKICRPLFHRGQVPDWLRPLLAEIQESPDIRLKDSDLSRRGLEPNRVRRWFKKYHGMTFQAFLRARRLGDAFGRIRHGERIVNAAFDSGYESLSGFGESFKKTTGFSPRESGSRSLIHITRILTPLGPMLAGANDRGISLLEFMDRPMLETQLQRVKKKLAAECVPGHHAHFDALFRQLQEYFAGTRTIFDLPLVLHGTPFQEKVWSVLRTIPYATTRSYREQAVLIGKPDAVRAVGRANGDNRIAIIVPCHRVVGSSGDLTGYGGGLWRKRYLLNHEQRHGTNTKR